MAAWAEERLMDFSRSIAIDFSGAYKVEGQSLKGGVAFRARIILFPQNSIIPIREAWSEEDGSWSFDGLKNGEYIVLAIDKTGSRNAATFSHITAVAM